VALLREDVEKPEVNLDSSFCPLYVGVFLSDFASLFSYYSSWIVSCERTKFTHFTVAVDP